MSPVPLRPASSVVPSAADVAVALDADGVLVFAVDGQQLVALDIAPAQAAASSLTLPIGFGVTGTVARTGRAVLLEADSPRNSLHRTLLGLEPGQTVARMCLPLLGLEGHVVGVLAAHRSCERPFGEAEHEAAEPFVGVLGLGLHAQQLWRAAHRHRTERDQLIKRAISAQEAERRRVAFDLHDGVTTALASMAFHLSAADLTVTELAARLEPRPWSGARDLERARDELVCARELADLAYRETRAAISGLHSLVLDDLGLVAALESLAQTATSDAGPQIRLFVDPAVPIDDIPDHAATALYRIAQEALSNAVRHADATSVVLSMRHVGDSIVLGCADDGKGFDSAERRTERAQDGEGTQHFGLSSIAERCAVIEASLRVESAPGRGTTILVELPL